MIGGSEWSLILFLSSWVILLNSENREGHKGVEQKDFYLWGAACVPLSLEYRTAGRC